MNTQVICLRCHIKASGERKLVQQQCARGSRERELIRAFAFVRSSNMYVRTAVVHQDPLFVRSDRSCDYAQQCSREQGTPASQKRGKYEITKSRIQQSVRCLFCCPLCICLLCCLSSWCGWLGSFCLWQHTYSGRQIVQGLSFLHLQNIVHGDIKPQNLLVRETRTHAHTYIITKKYGWVQVDVRKTKHRVWEVDCRRSFGTPRGLLFVLLLLSCRCLCYFRGSESKMILL